MRALVHSTFGDPAEVLEVAERPLPEPGPGQVRVRTVPAATPDAGPMDAAGATDVIALQDVVRDMDVGADAADVPDVPDVPDATDATDDAFLADDATSPDAGEDVTPLQGGCTCGVVAASPPRGASPLALLLCVAARRRRRRGPRDCEEV